MVCCFGVFQVAMRQRSCFVCSQQRLGHEPLDVNLKVCKNLTGTGGGISEMILPQTKLIATSAHLGNDGVGTGFCIGLGAGAQGKPSFGAKLRFGHPIRNSWLDPWALYWNLKAGAKLENQLKKCQSSSCLSNSRFRRVALQPLTCHRHVSSASSQAGVNVSRVQFLR